MIRAQPSVLSAFKALKTVEFWRQTCHSSSVLSNFRLYSSSNKDGNDKPTITIQEEGEIVTIRRGDVDAIAGVGDGDQSVAPVNSLPPGSAKPETITERLRRLSQSTPDDFVPSLTTEEAMDNAKLRYQDTLKQYREQFAQRDRHRSSNPNYRGPRHADQWDDNKYRRFSTSSAVFNNREDGITGGLRCLDFPIFKDQQYRNFRTASSLFSKEGEGVIDRLRRLSMTSEAEFEPSDGARKIRETSEARQRSVGHLDDRKFDQRNSRPNDERSNSWGRQTQGYGNNDNRGYRNYENQNRRNIWSDDEHDQSYRDPTRDSRITPFFRQERGSSNNSDHYRNPRSNSSGSSNYGDYRNHSSSQRDDSSDSSWKKYYSKGRHENDKQYDSSKPNFTLTDRYEKENNLREERKESSPRSYESRNSTRPKKMESKRSIEQIKKKTVTSVLSSSSNNDNVTKRQEEADLDLSAIHGDPDTFGTLSLGKLSVRDSVGTAVRKELLEDEQALGLDSGLDDPEEDDVRFIPDNKWSMKKLVKRVKELVDGKQVKEAVDTLTGAMAQGGFQFDRGELVYCYNLCISSCAQVGYVEMAFKLFNDMKQRGLITKPSTYTSLFNACANSPWEKEKNIERMNGLRQNMMEKGLALNQINYHSMIKGYGRCGDLESAFAIVDEMITQQQINPNTETFNMLFQACITNSENGFRHVLVTWRKMQSMRIRPDIFSYNLLLRAVRQCGIQLPAELQGELLEGKEHEKSSVAIRAADFPRLPAAVTEEESNDMLNLICLNDSENALKNFTSEGHNIYTFEDVIHALALPENRLAVLGGLRGIMSQLTVDKVGPNMTTVNELAQMIHPSDATDLIMLMKAYKLKPGIDFFNHLIKRCFLLHLRKQAEDLMQLLPEYNLTPNIMTWGVVATGCTDWNSAKNLLSEMDDAEFMPNIEIMGALAANACNHYDPLYVLRMMEETRTREVVPDARFILHIEQFKQSVKKGLVSQEIGKPIEPANLKASLENNWNEEAWTKFCLRYKSWMEKIEIRVEPENPWTEDFETFRKHRSHNPQRDAEDQASAVKSS